MNRRCSQCGIPLTQTQVASEHRVTREGTAGTRVRRVITLCMDCHAAGEYQQHQAREQQRAELLADLTDEERAGYLARKSAAA